MLFNSIDFAIFLPIVLIIYWTMAGRGKQAQNLILLCSSLFFYACWDWRFLSLLIFSTLLDFYSAIKISQATTRTYKKWWLILSITINLGILGVFKYYNFFVISFSEALSGLGLHINFWTLNILLPLGISFYTFHGLSYIIDIYKDKILPEKNIICYSLFVCFFPLLVAGPIERATHLLPQLNKPRRFSYSGAVDGLRQILWGLFKKLVIADKCGYYADIIFNNSPSLSGSTLLLGAIFFSIQIYSDFAGYSDIALGTARLFGIDLLRNFANPYFSRDMAEFWRRWHISLSTWFRDYLYIPLGGSKGGTLFKIRNTLIIFIVSGFWHGANWTFIFWGLLNGLYIIPLILSKKNRNNLDIVAQGKLLPSLKELFSMMITFFLAVFGLVIFRAENLSHAFHFISTIFSSSLFTLPAIRSGVLFLLLGIFIIVEWLGREQQYALATLGLRWPATLRWTAYYSIVLAIIYFAVAEKKFLYFQF